MEGTLNIGMDDVYEAPALVKAGDFANLTQGEGDSLPEGIQGQYDD